MVHLTETKNFIRGFLHGLSDFCRVHFWSKGKRNFILTYPEFDLLSTIAVPISRECLIWVSVIILRRVRASSPTQDL
jgi:hypothetical protein